VTLVALGEYRTAPREETRVGWLGRLMEAVPREAGAPLSDLDDVLSWSAHYGPLPLPQLHDLAATLQDLPDQEPSPNTRSALQALALQDRERLEILMTALQHSPQMLSAARDALAMANQLQHDTTARLQPELQRFKDLIEGA